jgi:hypothetical protein
LGHSLVLEGPHDVREERRQFPLRLHGVLAADNVVGAEREIVTNHNSTAERDANRQRLVVGVSRAEHAGVLAVGRAQRHDAEVARAVFGDAMVLFGYSWP